MWRRGGECRRSGEGARKTLARRKERTVGQAREFEEGEGEGKTVELGGAARVGSW